MYYDLTNIFIINQLITFTNKTERRTMNNLPKLVMVLFGISAVIDIAEKIHNWGHDKDKKNEKEEKKEQDEPSRV